MRPEGISQTPQVLLESHLIFRLIYVLQYFQCLVLMLVSEKHQDEDPSDRISGRMRLRRNDKSNIERARARTLRMTITIVAAFVWCWTPYVVMTLW